MQPDSIIPNPANPQNLNRFSYVLGNPINYNDPTGHFICSSDPNSDDYCPGRSGSGGGSNGNSGGNGGGGDGGNGGGDDDCNAGDEICLLDIDTRDVCDYGNCDLTATFLGISGTALDGMAFAMNSAYMVGTDIIILVAFLKGGPSAALAAYRAATKLYRLFSVIPNSIGTLGGFVWLAQGVFTGDTFLDMEIAANSQLQLTRLDVSGSLSQDAVVAGLNDYLSWKLPEPHVATIWSGVGIVYDMLRNPLAPSLSSNPPAFPTVVQPHFDISVNFKANTGSADFSWFAP